jgi:HPt (histidine-containing phosphotransfer) domain-containing protein
MNDSSNRDFPLPVDFSRLREVADTPDEIRDFIDLYQTETGEQLGCLERAVAEKNWPEVRRLAHRSAGASAAFGADSMAVLLQKLELAAKESNADACPALSRQAVAEFDQVTKVLAQYLQSIEDQHG